MQSPSPQENNRYIKLYITVIHLSQGLVKAQTMYKFNLNNYRYYVLMINDLTFNVW